MSDGDCEGQENSEESDAEMEEGDDEEGVDDNFVKEQRNEDAQ